MHAEVDEIVAVTMGPETAVRALHKAVSLGADRSVHLSDEALAGSDVAATGYALAKALEKESPDLVLLGQQSDDGECYTIGAVVADHLRMPSLTQVIKMDLDGGALRCERQAEYGYDTVEVKLPAVISVGDAINEPRYPSLKAIMGAKKKPLETVACRRRRNRRVARRRGGLARPVRRVPRPAGEGLRPDHRGRGHRRDRREDRRVARRKEADLMADVLTYVLHYEGAFNKNSLGAVSEGAARAAEIGGECHAVVVGGDDLTDELCKTLGAYGAKKVFRAKGPEGLAQPVVDVMAKVIDEGGHALRDVRRRTARLRDRRWPGRPQAGRRDDGGDRRSRPQDGKLVAERPILRDSKISVSHYRGDLGIIIGRINAFEIKQGGDAGAEVVDVDVEYSPFSTQAKMVQRGEQRGADVDIEGADILVAGGRGLGKAEGFELAEALAEGVRRQLRGRRDARSRRCRLVPLRGPDRPDGQDRVAEAVSGGRHLRRDPAQGRDAVLGEHRRDQQGRQRADLRVLRPRDRR